MLQKWHLLYVPREPPQSIKATLALLVSILSYETLHLFTDEIGTVADHCQPRSSEFWQAMVLASCQGTAHR